VSLKEKIKDDIKACMKLGEKQKLGVLRMLLSEVQYAQTSGSNQQDLDDAAVLKVISTYQKRLTKALEDFPEGEKRAEIRLEIDIVSQYLPAKVSVGAIDAAISQILNNTTERNFGILMKQVMAELGSGVDGKILSQMLKEKLSSS
jgi:uncharacterized protein YqeY